MYTYLAVSSQKVTGNVLVIFFVIGFRSFISNTVKLGPISYSSYVQIPLFWLFTLLGRTRDEAPLTVTKIESSPLVFYCACRIGMFNMFPRSSFLVLGANSVLR